MSPTDQSPQRKFLQTKGCQLAYLEAGQGEETLVCLHAVLDTADTFLPLMEILSERFRVLAFDLPGCGESAPLSGGSFGIAAVARCIAEALESVGIERATFIGHERGALISAFLASLDPARAKRLVWLSAALEDTYTALSMRMTRYRPLRWLARYALGERAFRWRLRGRFFTNHPSIGPRAKELARYAAKDRQSPLLFLQAPHPEERSAILQKLGSLQPPVLILHGENDRQIPKEDAKRLQEKLPQARLSLVKSCAHYPHEEQPQEVASLLVNWLLPVDGDALSRDTTGSS